MFEFYDKSFTSFCIVGSPFKTHIEDICTKKIKNIKVEGVGSSENKISIKEVKERSYSHNVDVQSENWRIKDNKSGLNSGNVPRKNPLQDISYKDNMKNN